MSGQIKTKTSPIVKPAETAYPLHQPLKERWSSRAFSGEPVNPEIIGSLLEAARWTPSSMNAQPWRFVVATKDEPKNYNRLFASLSEKNQQWAGKAPVLILAVAKTEMDGGYGPKSYAEYDTGQAVAHLTIQATTLGLNLHQMGGFSKEQVRESLELPDDYQPMTIVAIGYPGEPGELPPTFQARERSPRSRRALADIAYAGEWSRSIEHYLAKDSAKWNREE
ncbi:MAG: nitroreductase family protein [Candidatus Marinimicrobia bacterium]|nr:nitroreductase family protein [Candidatus Neomarinimicrobiota bacterium]MCF7828456.1 nitroreductase family protein [Candidatus Neomarinimicrobiota bacterium]MCF7880950.1 nitroreductase family protein [Candidatus Neomarinimicrobiota bacterium]